MKELYLEYHEDSCVTHIYSDDGTVDEEIRGVELRYLLYPYKRGRKVSGGIVSDLVRWSDGEMKLYVIGSDATLKLLRQAFRATEIEVVDYQVVVAIRYWRDNCNGMVSIRSGGVRAAFLSEVLHSHIREWVKSIPDMNWKGIFQELSDDIGTDRYTIKFMGDIESYRTLISACPEEYKIDILYEGER